jgi:hypothetical protein
MDTLWRVAPPLAILLGIYIPDLLLTIAAVAATRRPGFLVFAVVFPVLRAVDAAICLRSLGEAVTGRRTASGRWTSPARRAAATTETARPASS